RRGLRAAVEIGYRIGRLMRGGRGKFVADRAGETIVAPAVLTSATPASTAAASTAARPPLAILALLAAGKGWLLVGLFIIRESIMGAASGRLGHRGLHHLRIATGLGAFPRLAATTAAATAPPTAPAALSITVATAVLSCGLFVGDAFGLLGLDLGFGLDIETVVIVFDVILLRRGRRCLRREQRLRRFQRMHLLAAVDDEGLLAADRGIGDDRQRHLEAAFEVAQMAALVV